jgi:hypothetical protein
MKHIKLIASASVLAASFLAPGVASASLLLDTGAPTSSTGSPVTVVSTSDWIAAEFAVASTGVAITQLSAFLTHGAGSLGDTFTFDIYSNTSFTGRSNQRILEATATGTFTSDGGWNTATLTTPWTPSALGDYWVALQVSATSQTHGLDAPGAGISTSSGTAPALAFAVAGTNGQYSVESLTAPTTPLGIKVTETPVPLPAAAWLLLSGFGGLSALARKRRA